MAKIQLADFVKYGKLFDVYGKLLSEERQALMSLYFNYNMTLAEISKEKGISRQAVLEGISKACLKLDEFESKLNFNDKKEKFESKLKALKNFNSLDEIKEKVDEILGEI